jgi:hypothetical protein
MPKSVKPRSYSILKRIVLLALLKVCKETAALQVSDLSLNHSEASEILQMTHEDANCQDGNCFKLLVSDEV